VKSVFISHSWHDKESARRIAETVRAFGGRVWLDEAEIKLGDSLVEKIRAGIDSMDYVIALLSRKSVCPSGSGTGYRHEPGNRGAARQSASDSRIPLRTPRFLQGKLYADMSTSKSYRTSLPMLLDRLGVPSARIDKTKGGGPPSELSKEPWVRVLGDALTKRLD
jgi:hypothetical protein